MRRLVFPLIGLGCVLALVIACFGTVLFRNQQFGFRDFAHFYYPLYQRVQQEWDAGRVPLWEPEENSGMPLLGNPTAAVLYPGKLIYAVLPYPWAAKFYVIAHVLVAVAGMVVLLRHWGVSQVGAWLGALSYAFGTPVLFQYCNVIFLVGAAWLPFGVQGIDRWLRQGRRWGIALLAVVLALQTLGGDPQASYVLGLCAGGYAVGLSRARGRSAQRPRRWGWIVGLVLVLWIGATLGASAWVAATATHPDSPGQVTNATTAGGASAGTDILSWITPALWRRLVLVVWGAAGLALLLRVRKRPEQAPLRARLVRASGSRGPGVHPDRRADPADPGIHQPDRSRGRGWAA